MATLGTLASLITKLRLKLGYGTDASVMTDALLTDALNDALHQTNKHWPSVGVSYFETVAGQQVYTPLTGDQRRLRKVWYGCQYSTEHRERNFEWWNTFSGMVDSPETLEESEFSFNWNEPGMLTAASRYTSFLDRYFGTGSKITDYNQVYLLPKPATSGVKAYYSYAEPRFATVDDITDNEPHLVDAFWSWSLYSALTMVGSGPGGGIIEAEGADGTRLKLSPKRIESVTNRHYDIFLSNLPMSKSPF